MEELPVKIGDYSDHSLVRDSIPSQDVQYSLTYGVSWERKI